MGLVQVQPMFPPQPTFPQSFPAPAPTQEAKPVEYPPAVQYTYQDKPTHIELSGVKYNAFNVDRLNLDITNRQGFDKITPDLVIWNFYKYKVNDLQFNAKEIELSNFFNWTVRELDLKNLNLDFHNNGKLTFSGKYGIIPFTAELNLSITQDKKLMITIEDFKAVVSIPSWIRDKLIDLLLKPSNKLPVNPASFGNAFSIKNAITRINDNQLLVDLNKMKTPVEMSFQAIETTEDGITVKGGN